MRRENEGGRIVSLPVLAVQAADGKHVVHVRGKIDRVDAAESGEELAKIIDYKSSARKSVQLFRVYHGLAMQLSVYALVMQELGGYQAMAALYMNLGLHREMVEQLADAPMPGSDAFYQKFKPRGVVDAAYGWSLDVDARFESDESMGAGKSVWYNLSFNKTGAITKRSDFLTHGDFQILLTFVRGKIAELAGELVGGKIAPMPYRLGTEMPCHRCEYVSLCPFDRSRDHAREVARVGNDVAMEMMKIGL
jgi:ATP-dependent helicase/nuclease subunit B